EGARAHYEIALEKDRDFTTARCNLAGLLSEQGDIDNSAAQYREAIKSDPHFPAAHFNLARILRAQGRNAEAETEAKQGMDGYRKETALDPSSAMAHIEFGYALVEESRREQSQLRTEHKYNDAIKEFRRAAALDQQNPSAYNGLGRTLYQLSETLPAREQDDKARLRKEAIEAFDRVIMLSQNVYAYYNRGVALRRRNESGDDVKAREDFSKVLHYYRSVVERDPDNARAHREVGRFSYIVGRPEDAIKELGKAIDLNAKFTEARRARGLVRFYTRDFS